MKKCYRCTKNKPIDQFDKNQDWCKKCRKEYHAALWRDSKKHRDRVSARRERIRQENKEFIISIKSVPCADCGGNFHHAAMDLHHLENKKDNIARLLTYKRETLLKEIAKCIVLCSNCHRVRTYNNTNRKVT